MKKIILIALIISMLFCNTTIYANVEHNGSTGGSNGSTDNVTGDFNIVGGMDDERNSGIRVTLVDSITGVRKSKSIDFANNNREPVGGHFGKVNKLEYLGGRNLMISAEPYNAFKPKIPLPKIIGGDRDTLKKYFKDKNTLQDLATHLGISYDEIISTVKTTDGSEIGKYKLILEPVGYPLIKGTVVACTATELAMYNGILNNAIRKSPIMNFSHDNLPLSMFLEESDLGINAWAGSTTGRQSDSDIISKLGIHILSFTDKPTPPPMPPTIDVTYHENTEVITSIPFSISNNPPKNNRNEEPDPSVYVDFNFDNKDINILSNTHWGEYDLVNKGTIYPFIKWKTPKLDEKEEERIVQIEVTTGLPEPEKTDEKGNPVGQKKEKTIINAKIIKIKENTPPNPDVPYPTIPDDWNKWYNNKPEYNNINHMLKTGQIISNWLYKKYIPENWESKSEKSWYKYEVIEDTRWSSGENPKPSYSYRWNTYKYTAKLILEPNIKPANTVKTETKKGDLYTMKSAYGIDQHTKARIEIICEYEKEQEDGKTEKGTERINDMSSVTKAQNGISYFSDFNLAYGNMGKEKYWRVLESEDKDNDGNDINDSKYDTNILQFKKNHYSTYNNRTHFTPLWYPDGERYWVTTYVFDSWTPVGMLTADTPSLIEDDYNIIDKISVMINGNMYDDYYIQVLPDDYEIGGDKYEWQRQ